VVGHGELRPDGPARGSGNESFNRRILGQADSGSKGRQSTTGSQSRCRPAVVLVLVLVLLFVLVLDCEDESDDEDEDDMARTTRKTTAALGVWTTLASP